MKRVIFCLLTFSLLSPLIIGCSDKNGGCEDAGKVLGVAAVIYVASQGGGDGGPAEVPQASIVIKTEPVEGDIYLDGKFVGKGIYEGRHPINKNYTVSFGEIQNYVEPQPETFYLTQAGFNKTYIYEEIPPPPIE